MVRLRPMLRVSLLFSILILSVTSAFVTNDANKMACRSLCRTQPAKSVVPRLQASISELEEQANDTSLQRILVAIPLVSAILAFLTFGEISSAVHTSIEAVSQHTWVEQDGGKLVAGLLAPAINGPVIVSVSILFATLVSTTISSLYNRQETIRSCIIKEVEELRFLHQLIEGYPDDSRQEAKQYLGQYTDEMFANLIIRESSLASMISNDALGDFVVEVLNKLSKASDNGDDTAPGALVSGAFDSVTRINAERAERMAAVRSAFPATHFFLLTVLACAICFAFLLETDIEPLIFLAGVQLRLLWAALIGSLSSLAVVCYDLSSPFSGNYKVGFVLFCCHFPKRMDYLFCAFPCAFRLSIQPDEVWNWHRSYLMPRILLSIYLLLDTAAKKVEEKGANESPHACPPLVESYYA